MEIHVGRSKKVENRRTEEEKDVMKERRTEKTKEDKERKGGKVRGMMNGRERRKREREGEKEKTEEEEKSNWKKKMKREGIER